MVRSDWSKKWTTDAGKAKALAADPVFPGVSLDAIKFLQLKRHILFHGHEPLDTDTTPTLEGEAWLMHHGYTQAEGVDNLDAVPETGCLINIGFPKFERRYSAATPATSRSARPATKGGQKISRADAPLKRISSSRCTSTRRPGCASARSIRCFGRSASSGRGPAGTAQTPSSHVSASGSPTISKGLKLMPPPSPRRPC